ncbi:hypothetical protein L6164_023527 [Bauhinia variegata]|uniref:Uncharacterized protein n=1 Tax=Bauhinia variegata TaxID=167791 RepID=A0ACB9MLW9_BAUVA|nr:hypothetical protein L6164_023527 [Bauhinia variegata]
MLNLSLQMSEKNVESSGTKSAPVIVQSEVVFNARITLNESNYDVWSQLMEMHIAEREKPSYIRGKDHQPAESEDVYEKWYAENQKAKRWLLMSMAPEIMKRYLRLPIAREIWNALSKAFYDGSDELQVFALNQKAFTAKQNGKSLSEYYEELVEIFHELDHRDTMVMKDPDDVITYKKSIERLRVHIFLAGLDEEFDQVRGEILRKELVPGLEECHALIKREATGHTKDRCYELVGYPEWWDHSRALKKRNPKNISNVAEANIGGNAFGKGLALIATADTCGKALHISAPVSNITWIIDSGAIDHMVFDSRQITNIGPSSQKSISIANGNETPITEEGSLSLANNLNLDSVLLVPSLSYNLLSVSQLTKTLSCVAIF